MLQRKINKDHERRKEVVIYLYEIGILLYSTCKSIHTTLLQY